MPAELFLLVCVESSIFPQKISRFPARLPYTCISLNWLEKKTVDGMHGGCGGVVEN